MTDHFADAGKPIKGNHMKYPVGTKFYQRRGKENIVFTVVDFHVTYNLSDDIVRERYVCSYVFIRPMTDPDVCQTVIDRSLGMLGIPK